MIRGITIGLLVASLLACTTTLTLHQPSPSTIRESLAIGDRVQITTANKLSFDLRVSALSDDGIVGTDAADGLARTIPFDQIVSLSHRQVDRADTAWLVGGIVLTLGALAAILASLDNSGVSDAINETQTPAP